jgi:hypothetical protein
MPSGASGRTVGHPFRYIFSQVYKVARPAPGRGRADLVKRASPPPLRAQSHVSVNIEFGLLIARPSHLLGPAPRLLLCPKVAREEGQLALFQERKDAMVTVVNTFVTGPGALAPRELAE